MELSSEELPPLDRNSQTPSPEGEGEQNQRPLTLAVTGGTGFVGSHLLRLAVAQGHHVRALTRSPQIVQPSVTWIAGTLADPAVLCDGADAVIHLAGVVNARTPAGFDAGNVAGTATMLAAAERAGIRRFIHVSSLAAREPGLSAYGASKAGGEALVAASDRDWVIVRPPGVYGPGDTEMLPFYRMVARGFALLPGRGRFSLIEVGDLAAALLAVAAAPLTGLYEIADGQLGGYTHADLAAAIGTALGRQPRLFHLGPAGLRLGAAVDTLSSRAGRRLPKLSFDRARYLAHPDWEAATGKALPAALWQPQIAAAEGIAATAAWYHVHGWLRSQRS